MENLFQKIKIAYWSWNLEPILVRIWRIRWWSVAYLRATWRTFQSLPSNFWYFFPKNFLYFGKWNILVLRLKDLKFKIKIVLKFSQKKLFLYFEKWNFLEKLLIFQKGTCKAWKTKKICSEEISFMTFLQFLPHREIPCEAKIQHRDINF